MARSPQDAIGQESIPMLDLQGEVEELWDEINAAIQRVLRSGQFILGPEVEAFEEEVAEYLGVKHAIGVNSGTDALVIGLRALAIGPGDEVITTPFTFFATTEAILHVGATPVFVDIREDSFNIDPDLIEAAVTDRTRAIVPVHLFGNPAAMTKIMAIARKYDLRVLEDAAQSFGAAYFGDSEGDAVVPDAALVGKMTGAIGDMGAFSFYPTKNLGAYGDGGLVVTNDPELATRARSLRNHGASSSDRYQHMALGFNSRLDAVQAAILRLKLPHVPTWNLARRKAARHYCDLFEATQSVRTPRLTRGHVVHQFTVRLPAVSRDRIRSDLTDSGISTSVFYPRSIHRVLATPGTPMLEVSDRAAGEVLSLPVLAGAAATRTAKGIIASLDRQSQRG